MAEDKYPPRLFKKNGLVRQGIASPQRWGHNSGKTRRSRCNKTRIQSDCNPGVWIQRCLLSTYYFQTVWWIAQSSAGLSLYCALAYEKDKQLGCTDHAANRRRHSGWFAVFIWDVPPVPPVPTQSHVCVSLAVAVWKHDSMRPSALRFSCNVCNGTQLFAKGERRCVENKILKVERRLYSKQIID